MNQPLLKKSSLRELVSSSNLHATKEDCRIRASNDVEAIERWLDEYFDKPKTYRTYKKEAERFLVWCVLTKKTNLSSLTRDYVLDYIEFLKNPQPKEIWCGPRRKKGDNIWHPFLGPLSESAQRTALASLNSLMSYLLEARYVDFNPFSLVRKKNRFKKQLEEQSFSVTERILNNEEWAQLLKTIEQEKVHDEESLFRKNRLRFLVTILFFIGLRIDELSLATWSNCRKQSGKWWFFVRGKGGGLGKVPINSQLLQAIMKYRHSINKPLLPDASDKSPIICWYLNHHKTLTTRQMSNLIKNLAKKTAQQFNKDSESYKRLLRFSPHWLRHLSASRQDLAGISFTNIKNNLRHKNEQTTRIYVHAYDDNRHKEMEKLRF